MKLYDDFKRTDESPCGRSEPAYAFYNRCGWPMAAKVREAHELWFSRYPEEHKGDLRGRFVSEDNVQHYSGLFELVLHELFLKLGCEIVIHPELNNGKSKHPDFLVRHPLGDFYLEAVVVPDESSKEASAKKLLGVAYDEVNKMESKDFFLDLSSEGYPRTPVKTKDLKNKVQKFLNQLNYDEIRKMRVSNIFLDEMPTLEYEYDGTVLRFRPIPKSPEGRLKPAGHLIGSSSEGVRLMKTSLSIKEAVNVKAKRYGQMNLPYVIAVNTLLWGLGHEYLDALYGEEGMVYSFGSIEGGVPTRTTGGAWRKQNNNPRHTNVSAVLFFENFTDTSAHVVPIELHHHPKADLPYSSVLNILPQRIVGVDGYVQPIEGKTLLDILEVAEYFPPWSLCLLNWVTYLPKT